MYALCRTLCGMVGLSLVRGLLCSRPGQPCTVGPCVDRTRASMHIMVAGRDASHQLALMSDFDTAPIHPTLVQPQVYSPAVHSTKLHTGSSCVFGAYLGQHGNR